MADRNIGIALVLSSQDKASAAMNEFFGKMDTKLKAVGQSTALIGKGMAEIFAAKKGLDMLEKTTDAFGDMEAAGNHLKANLMGRNGIYDGAMYEKLFQYSKQISSHMTGSTAAYLDMIRVMKQNRIEPKDILGGIGEDAAMLAHYFDNMIPAATAEFAAHMKNDMGVATSEMYKVMDLVARVHDSGVGKTGQEAVDEMNQFFSKVGLGLANLHTQGIVASKQMAALGTIFMARGISGQSVGTNFRRIFDGLASADKLEKANAVAAQFGRHLDFFDKKGKFLGVENFVRQMGKLQGLSPTAVEAILKPFSGKQGLSTDFMQFLANEGLRAYPEMMRKIERQAELRQKVGVMMQGQRMQEAVLASNLTNTKASFGAAIQAPYKALLGILNRVTVAVGEFFDRHQKLAKVAGILISIASAGMMLMGVIKVIRGLIVVAQLLNFTLKLNPFMLWASLAVIAVTFIITYWDEIKAFFIKLWDNTKHIFLKAWEWIKTMFLNYTPLGLVIKHWSKITAFFSGLWGKVKTIFFGFFKWFLGLHNKFFDAGANIVHNIWAGIKSMAHKPIEAIKNIAHKIRQYLPFSPAKEGPLRDIHRVKLVETIAMSLRPQALIDAWHKTLGSFAADVQSGRGVPIGGGGSVGGPQMVFAPVIHLTGGATQADAKLLNTELEKQFERLMRDWQSRMQMVRY